MKKALPIALAVILMAANTAKATEPAIHPPVVKQIPGQPPSNMQGPPAPVTTPMAEAPMKKQTPGSVQPGVQPQQTQPGPQPEAPQMPEQEKNLP